MIAPLQKVDELPLSTQSTTQLPGLLTLLI